MDLKNKTIGFIGGGNMAEALIMGLLAAKKSRPSHLFVADPLAKRRSHLKKKHRVRVSESNEALMAASDVIVLAVKPQVMHQVLWEIAPELRARHVIISIAAGIDTQLIQSYLGKRCRLIRAMPNTPALVSQGITGLFASRYAKTSDRRIAAELFGAVGQVIEFKREGQLDWVTAVSGSGPAYVFSFLEAMIEAAQRGGLAKAQAQALVFATVEGSVSLAKQSPAALASLRERVTSKGGTTEAALKVLGRRKWHTALHGAIHAAARRAESLRKQARRQL